MQHINKICIMSTPPLCSEMCSIKASSELYNSKNLQQFSTFDQNRKVNEFCVGTMNMFWSLLLAVLVLASIPVSVHCCCDIHLGDIPSNPASSCKEVADTKLSVSRSGYHWLARDKFQAYCSPSIPPSESRGWMRVANISASQGCPSGLEPVTAGGRKLCRKTVDTGCSSVTFNNHGVSYSKVCGRAYGFNKGSPDGFQRHNHCPSCTIDKPYVDGLSITHGSPRQHIWSLAAAAIYEYYCPCTSSPTSNTYRPSFVGNDYSCEYETHNTYSINDQLWDGQDCSATLRKCCDKGSWFCKDLSQPTTDDIEVRLCCDENRSNEDVYIKHFELYVQ